MKRHTLLMSLTLLVGAVCLSGDSWKKCINACAAGYKQLQDFAQTLYDSAMSKAKSNYATCCATGNCPYTDPILCSQGGGGACCDAYGTDSNKALSDYNTNMGIANTYQAQCEPACGPTCQCGSGPDCSQANQDSSCDTGIVCLGGTCQSCSSGSKPCNDRMSCSVACNGNPSSQACPNDTCGDNNGWWSCQNTSGQWKWSCIDPSSPILIDVTGQGFQLTDAAHGVNFDFFGAGKKVRIAWTARGSGNAWLVLPDANGMVASGKNMFGNITPQPPSKEPNGFLALAVYDQPSNGGNADGVIDERDAIFSKLRLWQDKNHDGISQPDELLTLQQLGVVSISLHYAETKWTDAYGNLFHYRAAIQDAASARSPQWTYDVFLVIQGAR